MKRLAGRLLGLAFGLALGWYIGGLASPFNLPSAGAQSDHPAAVEGGSQTTASGAGNETADAQHGEADAGQQAARVIAPDPEQPEQISWYPSVLAGVVVLFAAAIVLGYPTLNFKGRPRPTRRLTITGMMTTAAGMEVTPMVMDTMITRHDLPLATLGIDSATPPSFPPRSMMMGPMWRRMTYTTITEPAAGSSPSLISRRMFWLLLAAIALVGLALQLAMVGEFVLKHPAAQFPWADGEVYWRWAGQMVAGDWVGDTPFHSAPFYPYLLGELRWMGLGLTGVFLFQVGLHIATAILLACVTRRRFGAAAGLLAAGLYLALSDPAVSTMRILSNSLLLLAVVVVWWRWAIMAGRPRRRMYDAALTGALVGWLALIYPAAALLVPALALWLIWEDPRKRAAWGRAAAAAGCAMLLIAPATLHNWMVCGEFIPITAHSGLSLAQGNQPNSTGVFTLIPGMAKGRVGLPESTAELYEHATGHSGTWGEVDAYFRRQVFSFWLHHPLVTAKLFARKAYYFFTACEYDDIGPVKLDRQFGLADLSVLAPLPVPWIMGLALAGLLGLRRKLWLMAPEWLFPALALLVAILFLYTPRYRLAAVPPLCALAAYAITHFRQLGYSRWSAAGLAVLFPLLTIFNHSATRFDHASSSLGTYTTVLSATQAEVGNRALAHGDLAEAERRFQAAIRAKGDNGAAHRGLGALLAAQKRYPAALEELRLAVEDSPQDVEAQRDLYNLYVLMHEDAEATGTLRKITALAPDWDEARLALAWILAASPDDSLRNGAEAVKLAQTVQPGNAADTVDGLNVLSAAYAEEGRFNEAAQIAGKARQDATAAGLKAEVEEMREHLQRYQRRQPLRATPRVLRRRP